MVMSFLGAISSTWRSTTVLLLCRTSHARKPIRHARYALSCDFRPVVRPTLARASSASGCRNDSATFCQREQARRRPHASH